MTKNRKLSQWAVSGVLLAAGAGFVQADPIVRTTAFGTLGADNQIMGADGQNRDDLNKGTSSNLELRNNTGTQGNNFIGVLRFDLTDIEAGGLASAMLNITLNIVSPASDITINVYGLNDAFAGGPDTGKAVGNVDELSEIGYTEGTANFAAPAGATAATDLTGNRAPGFDELKPGGNPAAFMQASATTLLGSITIPTSSAAQTTFSLSDTALVNFLKLDTNGAAVVYLVNMTSNTLVQITSGETGSITDAKKPNLTMTIPEPASVGMLGMGSVLLLRRRMADVH